MLWPESYFRLRSPASLSRSVPVMRLPFFNSATAGTSVSSGSSTSSRAREGIRLPRAEPPARHRVHDRPAYPRSRERSPARAVRFDRRARQSGYRVTVATEAPTAPDAPVRSASQSTPERDATIWLLFVGAGLAVTGIAVATDAAIGVGAAPFVGRYAWRI